MLNKTSYTSTLLQRVVIIFIAQIITICLTTDNIAAQKKICDKGMAIEWCSRNSLQPVEGIWDFPEDNVTVLITRKHDNPNITSPTYCMIAVETPDCRIKPGEVIGELEELPDAKSYKIKIKSKRNGLSIFAPTSSLAILTNNNRGLIVKKSKVKVTLNPSVMLSKYLRIVNFKFLNPVSDAPSGLLKIYPNDDGTPIHEKPLVF